MERGVKKGSMLLMVVAAVQQGVLGQLGLTEATARELVLTEVANGDYLGSSAGHTQLADAGRMAYKKLPASARGSVTTALFAWAKAYTATPAFKEAYLKIRSENRPTFREYDLTVEQEVQKKFQEQLANIEALRKAAASMAPADKAQMLEGAKEAEAQARNPAMMNADRKQREEDRAKDRADTERITREWQARYPAEVRGFVARTLRQFLEVTAGIDFNAKLETAIGEAGDALRFADPRYQSKPWQWVDCVVVGPDAVAAARTAAEAWLAELR